MSALLSVVVNGYAVFPKFTGPSNESGRKSFGLVKISLGPVKILLFSTIRLIIYRIFSFWSCNHPFIFLNSGYGHLL